VFYWENQGIAVFNVECAEVLVRSIPMVGVAGSRHFGGKLVDHAHLRSPRTQNVVPPTDACSSPEQAAYLRGVRRLVSNPKPAEGAAHVVLFLLGGSP